MSALKIDADALFRAVTALDYKLLAYYLDLRDGAVVSRTLTPEEVREPPPGPRVKPLPLLGGDLRAAKSSSLFPEASAEGSGKPKLFADETPAQKKFQGDFWKREGGKRPDPFGGEFKPISGTKKLAELFGEKMPGPPDAGQRTHGAAPRLQEQAPPPSHPASGPKIHAPAEPPPAGPAPGPAAEGPLQRIPPADAEQHMEWMRAFAKDCGDPEIRERLQTVLRAPKAPAAFERALRKYQRMNQQWERYHRKQALHYAAAWLKDQPIQWELVEPGEPPIPLG